MNSLTGMPRSTRIFLNASSVSCGFCSAAWAPGRACAWSDAAMSRQAITSPAPQRVVRRLSFMSFSLLFFVLLFSLAAAAHYHTFLCVTGLTEGGLSTMRHSPVRSMIGLLVLLAFASVALAQ